MATGACGRSVGFGGYTKKEVGRVRGGLVATFCVGWKIAVVGQRGFRAAKLGLNANGSGGAVFGVGYVPPGWYCGVCRIIRGPLGCCAGMVEGSGGADDGHPIGLFPDILGCLQSFHQ